MNCFLREPYLSLVPPNFGFWTPIVTAGYEENGLPDCGSVGHLLLNLPPPPLCISNELGYYSLASIFVNITGMSWWRKRKDCQSKLVTKDDAY